jgi:hypothetical protein
MAGWLTAGAAGGLAAGTLAGAGGAAVPRGVAADAAPTMATGNPRALLNPTIWPDSWNPAKTTGVGPICASTGVPIGVNATQSQQRQPRIPVNTAFV